MNVIEAIKTRRSIKGNFLDKPVEKEKIEQVIEAGLWAPSGQNQQPCRFIVVTDPELLAEIEAEMFRIGETVKKLLPIVGLFKKELSGEKGRRAVKSVRPHAFHGAPGLIIIGAMSDSSSTYRKDCSLAAQNMMLAAHELGLGTCCMGWITTIHKSKALTAKLDIPKGFEICQAITIGYYDTDKTPKTPQRKSVDEATTWFLKDEAGE
ncbi:MAG: nitroreductase family protein [Planctomycetes bacterium]|nr:nitroreductase family protein [Planctomycetota bacterium]